MVNFSEIAEIYSAALSTNGVQIWFTMLQGHCLVQQLVHFIWSIEMAMIVSVQRNKSVGNECREKKL